MPDTATAVTATNAETRAAGSRILGFILGGGGAIVDKLFDVASFVTRDAAANVGFGVTAPYCRGEFVSAEGVTTIALGKDGGSASLGIELFGLVSAIPASRVRGFIAAGNSAIGTAGDLLIAPRSNAACSIRFLTGSSGAIEVARLNASGYFGLGTAVPAARMHILSSGEIARFETTAARGSGNAFISINDPTGRKGYVGYGGGNDRMEIINSLNADLLFATNNAYRWQILAGGDLAPVSDNAFNFGSGGARPKLLYAVTGTINTSDEREKTWRGAANVAELNAAKRIAAELGFYQWNDAIADKGVEAARYHYGVRAQAVWEIMADEGLIHPLANGSAPHSAYAFLCYDEWDAVAPVEAVEEVRDEEGEIIVDAQPAQPGREAGNRFGIRPDQLALFLIAAQEARLSALETA